MKSTIISLSLILLLGFFVSAGWTDQQEPAQTMSAEEKAMMEAWQKHATPGPHHQHLAIYAGNWNTASKMWMAPNTPAQESKGSCVNKMILGNRFLEMDCTGGTMMGMEFHGMGTTGYDNTLQKYVFSWIDNMGTSLITGSGTCEQGGKVHNISGEMIDPMTGKNTTFRYRSALVDPDKYIFEWYGPGPDGKEFKMMEITYTR